MLFADDQRGLSLDTPGKQGSTKKFLFLRDSTESPLQSAPAESNGPSNSASDRADSDWS